MSNIASPQSSSRLFYNEPAKKWEEALPVGNGRLGAMVYGGVSQEHIQFNEETLWTGEPRSYAHQGAKNYLDGIRRQKIIWVKSDNYCLMVSK